MDMLLYRGHYPHYRGYCYCRAGPSFAFPAVPLAHPDNQVVQGNIGGGKGNNNNNNNNNNPTTTVVQTVAAAATNSAQSG